MERVFRKGISISFFFFFNGSILTNFSLSQIEWRIVKFAKACFITKLVTLIRNLLVSVTRVVKFR